MASMVCLGAPGRAGGRLHQVGQFLAAGLDVRHDGLQGLDLLVDGFGENPQVLGGGLEIDHDGFGRHQELGPGAFHVVQALVKPDNKVLLHDQHPQTPLGLGEVLEDLVQMIQRRQEDFLVIFQILAKLGQIDQHVL